MGDWKEFVKYFGYNRDLYDKLLPLKRDGELSWEQIKNLKWENIDLEHANLRTQQFVY